MQRVLHVTIVVFSIVQYLHVCMCLHACACIHVHARVQVDALKQKHVLLFVAEALTGSLETQRKMRQVRALRGKLRDGTIRGGTARQAAILEMEKLKKELNISSGQEISSVIDNRGSSVKDGGGDDGRLHDSKDKHLLESQSSSTFDLEEEEELSLPSSTEGPSTDYPGDGGVLPDDASTEPGQEKAAITKSLINLLTNQNGATCTTDGVSSDDGEYISDSDAPLLSHDGGTRGESSSDGVVSPFSEDETRIGGKFHRYTHTHTHTHTHCIPQTIDSSLYYYIVVILRKSYGYRPNHIHIHAQAVTAAQSAG